MVYDSNSNPRHLEVVSPEAQEEQLNDLRALEREVERLRKKAGVFKSDGWKLINKDLISLWQQVDTAVRSRKMDSMQDVEYCRGQLNAIEFMFNLAAQTIEREQHAQKALKEAEQALSQES